MAITVICEACQQEYRLGNAWAGKTAKCKKCGHAIHIPSPGGKQRDVGGPPAPAPVAAPAPSGATAHRGGKCPICDSPMSASDETCSVCGYSASASKHLAVTEAASIPKAASAGTKEKSGGTADKGAGSSQLTMRLLTIGGIALAALLVVAGVGMGVSKVLEERARLQSRDRLNLMMEELREARDASRVQNIDWDFNQIDLKEVVREYAVKFAEELPYVPEYIQELEGKDTTLADDKRRWIISLINALPTSAGLSPLKQIPSNSFAYEAATKKLAEASGG